MQTKTTKTLPKVYTTFAIEILRNYDEFDIARALKERDEVTISDFLLKMQYLFNKHCEELKKAILEDKKRPMDSIAMFEEEIEHMMNTYFGFLRCNLEIEYLMDKFNSITYEDIMKEYNKNN